MNSPFGNSPATRVAGTTKIQANGLCVTVHTPPATTSRFSGGQEVTANLAPASPTEAFYIDEWPGCPESWMRGDADKRLTSVFIEAVPGKMVWFDFNGNREHRHDVAVILSAQGLNALTGQRLDQKMALAQYRDRCPAHNERFLRDRFCTSCGHDWPAQNYLASTSCRYGTFWRDGFCAENGETREFLFTEVTERGVAANLIGEERVDAFGCAFYTSRDPKPAVPVSRGRGGLELLGDEESFGGHETTFESLTPTRGMRGGELFSARVEVAAGAKVNQRLEPDTKPLAYWNTEPDALVFIYYANPILFRQIMAEGSRRKAGSFLGGIKTGNP